MWTYQKVYSVWTNKKAGLSRQSRNYERAFVESFCNQSPLSPLLWALNNSSYSNVCGMLFRKFNVWTHSKRTSPLQDLRPLDTSTRGACIRSGALGQNTLRGLRPVDTSRICALWARISVCKKCCTHPQHRGFEQSFGFFDLISSLQAWTSSQASKLR